MPAGRAAPRPVPGLPRRERTASRPRPGPRTTSPRRPPQPAGPPESSTLADAANRLLADAIGRARTFGAGRTSGLETTLRHPELGLVRLVLEGVPGAVRAELVARDQASADAILAATERLARSADAPAGISISVRAETGSGGRAGHWAGAGLATDGSGPSGSGGGAAGGHAEPLPGGRGRPATMPDARPDRAAGHLDIRA